MEGWGWRSINYLIAMKYVFILSFTIFFSCHLIDNDSINEIDSDELTEFLQINDAILLGDINGDGLLNVQDIVIIVNNYILEGLYSSVADMNQDGQLNVLDVIILVGLIIN